MCGRILAWWVPETRGAHSSGGSEYPLFPVSVFPTISLSREEKKTGQGFCGRSLYPLRFCGGTTQPFNLPYESLWGPDAAVPRVNMGSVEGPVPSL